MDNCYRSRELFCTKLDFTANQGFTAENTTALACF